MVSPPLSVGWLKELLFLLLFGPEIRQEALDLNMERSQERYGRESFPKKYRRSLEPVVKIADDLLKADWNGGRRENRWDNRHGIGYSNSGGKQAPGRKGKNKLR